MAYGISPKLPLLKDPDDGYALNKTYEDLTMQNLKMIVLTSPGERIMEPEFGVGLRNFLFENLDERTYSQIRANIIKQTNKYMPFIAIDNIHIGEVLEGPGAQTISNSISIVIEYVIKPLNLPSKLVIKHSVN